jgi:hypothetical protein
MPESLEDYLQRLLQQASERKASAPSPERRPQQPLPQQSIPVLEAEVVELEEIPEPEYADLEPIETAPVDVAPSPASEGAFALETRLAGDRPLGNLGATSTEADTAAALRAKTIVDELLALLHSPGGVQKAFVLSEILQRPEERW